MTGNKPRVGGTEGKRTDPAQSERFLEAARQAGVDKTGEASERAFDKVARPRKSLSDSSPAPQLSRRNKGG